MLEVILNLKPKYGTWSLSIAKNRFMHSVVDVQIKGLDNLQDRGAARHCS